MHKLLDLFEYRTHRLFSKLGEVTCNKIVKYDYECNLLLSNFLNFYKVRVLTVIEKMENKDIMFINSFLGLPRNTEILTTCNMLTTYFAETTIQNLVSLTRFKISSKLSESVSTDELRLPSIIVDLTRAINCNHKIRQILGSESVLYCNSLKINHNLDEKLIKDVDLLKFTNLKFVKLIELLKLDKIEDITDFKTLYHSNDYDFSFYTQGDDANLNIIVGDNNTDEDTIAAILLRNKITNTENYYPKTRLYSVSIGDSVEIIRTGNPEHSQLFGMEKVSHELMTERLNSKLTKFSNKQIIVKEIDGGQQFKSTSVIKDSVVNGDEPIFRGFSKSERDKRDKRLDDLKKGKSDDSK